MQVGEYSFPPVYIAGEESDHSTSYTSEISITSKKKSDRSVNRGTCAALRRLYVETDDGGSTSTGSGEVASSCSDEVRLSLEPTAKLWMDST